MQLEDQQIPLQLKTHVIYRQSRRQRSTDEGAGEVTKGGDDIAQSKKNKHMWPIHVFVGP